ncbi:DUF2752 domain-containing protein [Draconibacterium orientale]|uniref:DUF2752 domain-containing protein n=1 Tax=Draconibacterium orientale TaxID=1168034 RepID=UPI00374A3FA6
MQCNYKLKYLGAIIILVSGYFFLYNYSNSVNGHTVCVFKNMTGIPCPACGSIRATLLLFHGEFWKSIQINPFGIITNTLIIGSIIWMIIDIINNRETFFPFLKRDWNWKIKIIVTLIILINWILNIEKGN